MKTTIVSMKVRVKEITVSDVEKIKDLFRALLNETMVSYPSVILQGLKILPKCVGITKIDRRLLFSGMAIRKAPDDQLAQLQSGLLKKINEFLEKNNLKIEDIPDAITLKLYHLTNSESEFVAGKEKVMTVLRTGAKKSSEIADATNLEGQLANILLCMLEEERLIRREETDNDDIFHLA